MNIISVIGARPQFVKAAAVSRELARHHSETIVHTGQHYDAAMSDVFFDELDIPKPKYNLEIGSGSHGKQTGAMLAAIEEVLLKEKPDCVLLFGDTNSTIAGAMAAAKLHIPIAHVEAGLRSFNRKMPEEINRIVTDRLSTWLFSTSSVATKNLANEGITEGVETVGDVMYDATRIFGAKAESISSYPESIGHQEKSYYLATVHRAENTDDPGRLKSIFSALGKLDHPVVLPIHPRTAKSLKHADIIISPNLHLLNPVGYFDMLKLVGNAICVITDSGGLQKEAYYLGTPCVTMRPETEWVETVDVGWNVLVDADEELIINGALTLSKMRGDQPLIYGAGDASARISEALRLGKH